MRASTSMTWAMAVTAAVIAGCSKTQSKKPLQLAAPTAPQIAWRESPERVERAPIALTASDGTGLRLTALSARSVIEDPLAFTELHLTFHNPEPRRREGRFEITLPHGAAISRFAMQVAGGWQEGEVVERRRAQQVYEDFLHRKQDPALLEKDAGNEFAARVFPIEANASKEIIVAYSEERQRRDDPHRILLAGLPELERIDIDVRVGGSSATGEESTDRARSPGDRLRLSASDFAPEADVEVRLPPQQPFALRSGELVVARIAPIVDAPDAPIDGLTVLFDTSASRALGFGAQIERLGALIAELARRAGQDFDLRVVAFDQSAEEAYRGPASGFGLRAKAALLARDALGASDLAQALAFLARDAGGHARVLVVSDGVVTAGADDTTALREAVAKLAAHGVRRLDVLAEGGIQDRESLAALTRAGLAQAGVVLDARSAPPQLADRLWRGARERVEVKIAGATFIHPSVLEGVQAGDERLVFAELPADVPVQIELVGAGAEALQTLEAPRPLLERAFARAKIERLGADLRALRPDAEGERAELERQIVALSQEQRVVSDYTALLVLETAADYERFGIAQNALTQILRVGDEGIELFDRRPGDEMDRGRLQVARDDRPPLREHPVEAPEAVAEGEASLERAKRPAQIAPPIAASDQEASSRAASGSLARSADAERGPGALDRGIGALATGAGRRGDFAPEAKGESLRTRSAREMPAASPSPAKSASAAPPPAPAPAAPAAPRAQAAAPAAEAASGDDFARAAEREEPVAAAQRRSAGASEPAADALAGADPGDAALMHERRLSIAAPLVPEARAEVRLRGAFGLASEQAASVLRGLQVRARQCYGASGALVGAPAERIALELAISDKGVVADARVASGALADARAQACIVTAARGLRFPKPEAGSASVQASVALSMREVHRPLPDDTRPALAAAPRRRPVVVASPALDDAYGGVLAEVLAAVRDGDAARALARAAEARAADPGDVIALVALGEALEAQRDYARAARAYGSLIDLFPSRADLRRMAAARLERLPGDGLALAVDSYRRARDQRPDHPSSHRALAYALWKHGDREGAFDTLERALQRGYAPDRFEGAARILGEDLSLLGAAWISAEPAAEPRVRASLAAHGVAPATAPSLRFVLSWETDANDVDFHIYDGRGGHAYYMKPKLPSGGALYADVTTGYGPECFAIPQRARAYPYVLQAHYYARGPMGYGMGKLQVVEYDGRGRLAIAEHPFVIMKDKAFVELARLDGPLG